MTTIRIRRIGAPDPDGAPRPINPSPNAAVNQSNDLFAKLMSNPKDFVGVHPLVIELLNQVRLYQIELMALRNVIVQRGLVTMPELAASRQAISQAADQQLNTMVAQLGRQFKQAASQEEGVPSGT